MSFSPFSPFVADTDGDGWYLDDLTGFNPYDSGVSAAAAVGEAAQETALEAADRIAAQLPLVAASAAVTGLGAAATLGLGIAMLAGTVYLLSEGKASNNAIKALDPGRLAKGLF